MRRLRFFRTSHWHGEGTRKRGSRGSWSFDVFTGAALDNRFSFWLNDIAFFKGGRPVVSEI